MGKEVPLLAGSISRYRVRVRFPDSIDMGITECNGTPAYASDHESGHNGYLLAIVDQHVYSAA